MTLYKLLVGIQKYMYMYYILYHMCFTNMNPTDAPWYKILDKVSFWETDMHLKNQMEIH